MGCAQRISLSVWRARQPGRWIISTEYAAQSIRLRQSLLSSRKIIAGRTLREWLRVSYATATVRLLSLVKPGQTGFTSHHIRSCPAVCNHGHMLPAAGSIVQCARFACVLLAFALFLHANWNACSEQPLLARAFGSNSGTSEHIQTHTRKTIWVLNFESQRETLALEPH